VINGKFFIAKSLVANCSRTNFFSKGENRVRVYPIGKVNITPSQPSPSREGVACVRNEVCNAKH
jgi:hypothetical protein